MTSITENEMQEMVYEDMFSRMFGYLRHGSTRLNRESALTAIKLIEELLVAETPDVMDRVIVELPRRLERADIAYPVVCPPVNRGSIGYRQK